MTKRQRATVRLSRAYFERLDEMASALGCPRSTIIHNAVTAYLDRPAQALTSAQRLAQTTEYMQIVADLFVSRDMPEKRDAILATVAQRLEQFHGGQ